MTTMTAIQAVNEIEANVDSFFDGTIGFVEFSRIQRELWISAEGRGLEFVQRMRRRIKARQQGRG